MPLLRFLALVAIPLLLTGLRPAATLAAPAASDATVANGHFYSQANGQGGAGGTGFAVTDDDRIPLWTTFQSAGGVAALGYPASRRFTTGGFIEQVFQKAVLQWAGHTVAFLNVLDVLHDAGKDGWLQATWMTPPPASTTPDTGLPWDQVVARHEAYLDSNSVLRAAYFSAGDPLARYGLPMSPVTDVGAALVVRCQRAVLQLWTQAEPWAAAGTVTVANAGDILKASGLLPPDALQPVPAPSATQFTYVALGASDAAGYGASTPDHGYVALLGAKLAARFGNVKTVDLGIDGATTAEVTAQEASHLAALRPTLVTITIGPNDIIHFVSPGQFNSDLDHLLSTAQASGASIIAIAAMPDFSLTPDVPTFLQPIAHQLVVAYNAIIIAQAHAHGALLVDLYTLSEQMLPAGPNLVGADGFHPDDAGYALYAATFWAALQGSLPA